MKLKSVLKKIGANIYKNRANIEFVAGVAAVVGGTVWAVSRAEKAVEVKYEKERRYKMIELTDEADGWVDEHDRRKACFNAAKNTAVGYFKVYALPIGVEAAGLVLIGVSHVTLNRQVEAISAALASTSLAFSQYRERVREDVGEEKDQEYLLGAQYTKLERNPDGTITQTTVGIPNKDKGANLPPHCILFDEGNTRNWEPDARANRNFLEDHQRWLNDKLWSQGWLFENEIRKDLGFPITKVGNTSGILAEDENGNRQWLSLGLDAKNERAQAFRDGYEPSILLQLNIEDNIIDKLNIERS